MPSPRPLAPSRGDEEERRPNVACEHLVEGGDVELCRRSEERDPGVVDQDVDVADLVRPASVKTACSE
jgi:hypothetical protein